MRLSTPGEEKVTAVERCKRYRRRILDMSQKVTALHVAPAFSCIEIVDLIYHQLLSPADTFIMSKGHGVVAQYVLLEDLGVLTKEDLDLMDKPGGRLGGHPDLGVPGIAASTGSLGHGLGMAVGMAYAERLNGTPGRVYCLLSDGECQEGSTWEAVMMAANLRLDNLTVFVDNNDFGGLARMSKSHPAFYPLKEKFRAFGWVADGVAGHDEERIRQSAQLMRRSVQPLVVICETIKGKGVSYMENNNIWHYRSPNAEEYALAMQELA